MNKMFTQPTGPVAKQVNKQSIARVNGIKQSAVGILSIDALIDSYTVLYDPSTQTSWFRGLATGTPVSWGISDQVMTLVTSSGTFSLSLADLRQNLASSTGFKHIGQVSSTAVLALLPGSDGDRVLLTSYHEVTAGEAPSGAF